MIKRIYYLFVILFLFCIGNVYSAGSIQVSVGMADASAAVGIKTRVVSIKITTDKKIKYVYVFHGNVQSDVLSRYAILRKYDKKTGKIASFAEKYEVETSLVLPAPTTECSCEVTKSDTYTIAVETASGQIGMRTIQILNIDNTPPENVTNALCSHYPNGMVYVKWDNPKDSDFEKTELLINGEHVFISGGIQKYLQTNVFDETVKVQARTYDDIGNASEWSSCFEIIDLPFVTDLVMRHSWDIEKGIREPNLIEVSMHGFCLKRIVDSDFSTLAGWSDNYEVVVQDDENAVYRIPIPEYAGTYNLDFKECIATSIAYPLIGFETLGRKPIFNCCEYDENPVNSTEAEYVTVTIRGCNFEDLKKSKMSLLLDKKDVASKIQIVDDYTLKAKFLAPDKNGSYALQLCEADTVLYEPKNLLLVKRPTRIIMARKKIPDWMVNSLLLYSDLSWGKSRTFGDLFQNPEPQITYTDVEMDEKSLKFTASYEEAGISIMKFTAEFKFARLSNAGTCYLSYIRFDSPLTFQSLEKYCWNPNDPYDHGQCHGVLKTVHRIMYVEVANSDVKEVVAEANGDGDSYFRKSIVQDIHLSY